MQCNSWNAVYNVIATIVLRMTFCHLNVYLVKCKRHVNCDITYNWIKHSFNLFIEGLFKCEHTDVYYMFTY